VLALQLSDCGTERSRPYADLVTDAPPLHREPTWTLGHRDGDQVLWCIYCGRNCIADQVRLQFIDNPSGHRTFACWCCYYQTCQHSQPIALTCDLCRRPLTSFAFAGGRVRLLGSITPEHDMRTKISATASHEGRKRSRSSQWASRVWDVSADGAPWDDRPGAGGQRYKIVCIGRRHRREWLIKAQSLPLAYVSARRHDLTAMSVSEFARLIASPLTYSRHPSAVDPHTVVPGSAGRARVGLPIACDSSPCPAGRFRVGSAWVDGGGMVSANPLLELPPEAQIF
jgi:hypothetical protein